MTFTIIDPEDGSIQGWVFLCSLLYPYSRFFLLVYLATTFAIV